MPTNKHTPLVSVVIPTYGRPEFLSRAITSALEHQGPSVEVIVVPNGPDKSWETVQQRWSSESRVIFSPIETAHACVARNHGKSLAQGKYLRFLDDDDYLLTSAQKQIKSLENTGLDISVGVMKRVSEDGASVGYGLRKIPNTNNLTEMTLVIGGNVAQPGHFLFRYAAIQDCNWDEDCHVNQDKTFIHSLVRKKEWALARETEPVGVFTQHGGTRISTKKNQLEHRKIWSILDIDTLKTLKRQNRLTSNRASMAATTLWHWTQQCYSSDKKYWQEVINQILYFAPSGWHPQITYRPGTPLH